MREKNTIILCKYSSPLAWTRGPQSPDCAERPNCGDTRAELRLREGSKGQGAGDEVIMSIAGHVSRAMLSRYSHVRMEVKRRAPDEIAARQRTADEKRKEEAEQQRQLRKFLPSR